ncbi:hypothetical protein like AT3G14470 [Hibiscus trionum]|uniref:NB-ARC domain-containing protein n=1 Tax=Hibiscus trionum TaxID=183268 RepID=A0A9W7MLA7_HIBTR|nr:hypothetical protein like AT3G14470 [Hibiscus trionum]
MIVTTRSLKVASIMSSFRPYELTGLPREDCLILFTKWAFNDGGERQHPNLVRIGEEIVMKCKGVPLAVRTLGSLLFLKTDESYWISIRDSEMWRLEQSENDILPVLKLSYNHLPSHLQQCLSFFSLYKKDTVYYSDQVVHSWMANGLLEHRKQNQEWEDVGYRYLNELQSRCFIHKEEDHDLFFTFKMHDLIHDLALEVSQKECRIVNCQTEIVDRNVRHLSFCDEKLEKVPQVLKKLKNVRTVIVQEVSKESKTFHESLINICVSNFKYIRALSFRNSPLKALPNSIGNLKHLRDFDLERFYNIRKLPSSFYKLQSLQTLRMYGVPLVQLPENMESLIELRYLEVTGKFKHFKEIQPGSWTSLQCLELLSCENLECLPKGMQYLTSLRRLVLYACLNLESLPQSLKFLTKLEDLRISCCDKINLQMEAEEQGDEDLQLSLKTFALWQLNVFTDLQRSSSTLKEMRIENCYNFAALPAWIKDLTSLHKLEIMNCPKLSALPEGMDNLVELRELNIKRCPEMSRRYRRDGGADWHKIAHIQEVHIK